MTTPAPTDDAARASTSANAAFDQTTDRGRHVAGRLRRDHIAWLTTVRAGGQPDSVPVWFLWQADGTLLIYSQPNTPKVRNISGNEHVSLTLDDTHGGSDVVRVEGVAQVVEGHAPAHAVAEYVAKYGESITYIGYDDAEAFAEVYVTAIVITPTRYRI